MSRMNTVSKSSAAPSVITVNLGRSVSRSIRSTKSTRALDDLADTHIAIAPDGGYGWVVLFAAFLCNFVADGVIYPFSTFSDAIARDFLVRVPDVSVASSLMAGFYYLGGPLVCALINRYGFRIIGIIGGITSALGLFVSSRMNVLPAFISIYGVLGGFGFGMTYAASVVVVGFYFSRWRALATSIMACGSGTGIIVMPLFVEHILNAFDWRKQFLILAGICGITIFLPVLYRPLQTVKVTTTIDKSTASKLIAEDSSILTDGTSSVHKSKEKFRQKMKKYHNEEFPRASELPKTSTIYITIPKTDSSESILIAGGESLATLRRPTAATFKDDQSNILSTYTLEESRLNCCKLCCKQCHKCWRCGRSAPTNRPMYREDILYGASLALLQPRKSLRSDVPRDQGVPLSHELSNSSYRDSVQLDVEALGFSMSVTRAATQRDIQEQHKCKVCPEAVVRILSTMLDYSLFKSPSFLCIGISGFFTMLSLLIPYIYINKLGRQANLSESEAKMLLPVLGIANLIGRILCGLLSVIPRCNVIAISYISLALCGIVTSFSCFCNSLLTFYLYVSAFGLSIAAFATLRAPVIVEVLGIEKLTNALGLIMLFHGVAALLGLPVASTIIKIQNYKYDGAFIFSGVCLLISGLLLVPVKLLSRWELRKYEQKLVKDKINQIRDKETTSKKARTKNK